MLVEAKRLGMKRVWLYFLLSGITAMAFTFPLFMAFRERKLLERRLAGGSMEKFEFDNHRVDVWAPKTITATTPILIMHDGRNLFDEKDSYTGKTWENPHSHETGGQRAAANSYRTLGPERFIEA